MLLTNGQVANHKRWMVRCSPLAPGFSLEQSTVRQHTPQTTPFHTLNLPHSEITANVPYTYCYNLPPPSFLNTNFVAERGNTPNCSEVRPRASAVGGQYHNHHAITNSQVPSSQFLYSYYQVQDCNHIHPLGGDRADTFDK